MPLIPEEKLAEIRDRTDIVAVISEYVALRTAGANHKGLCPFHAENTPSFNVSAGKQMFHCFGCGKSGDVIGFLRDMEGRSFVEVARDLARRAGIELPETEVAPSVREAQRQRESERSRLLRVVQLACDFFRGELTSPRGERGRAYIDKRGISAATQAAFLLGYAPPGWDGLVRHLEAKKVPAELGERAGLIRPREGLRLDPSKPPSKSTHFDLFRDRVIFPLLGPQGEVIAFGGRTLDADPGVPKYINSPESALYKKGESLYGLHLAKQAIRRQGRAILVEGNFDVLAMHDRGLGETVAPMGTALTREQLHLLKRYSPGKLNLMLDGDGAGLAAAARAVGLCLDEELLAYVVLLPHGEDPDTFVRQHGAEGVELLVRKGREAVEYFCSYVWKRAGASIVERVKVLEEEAAPVLRRVKNETARRRYAERLALELDLPLDTIGRVLRGGPATATRPASPGASPGTKADEPPPKLAPTDRELVRLIADHPRLLQRLRALGVLEVIHDPALREALVAQSERLDSVRFDAVALADRMHQGLRTQIIEAAMSGHFASIEDPEKALTAIVKRAEQDKLLIERRRVLTAARATHQDDPEIRRLNLEATEVNQRRLGLKG